MLRLIISDIPTYDFPDLNVKIPDRPLSSLLLDKDSGTIQYIVSFTDSNMHAEKS